MDEKSEAIFEIIMQGKFNSFLIGMNDALKRLNVFKKTVIDSSKAINEAYSGFSVFGDAKNQQAMQAMNTQYTHLQEQLNELKPIAKTMFDPMIKQSMTAKDSVNEMLQSQKSAQKWQQEYYTGLQESLKPLAEETRNALMANVKPSLTAEQAVNGLLQKQKELASWSKQYGQDLQNNNTALKTFGNTMNNVARAGRALTMQFLGVMFFGMMLQRTFSGLFKPAMAAFGIMDLWSTMLLVVFLPVMEALFPLFLKFVSFFIELPDGVQMAIGIFAMLILIFGTILMVVGQLGLGLFSLIGLISILPTAATAAIGTFLSVLGAILPFVLIILVGIWLAWKENFGNIRDWFEVIWDGIKQQIEGLKQIVSGVMDIVKGILTGDFDLAIEGVKKLFNGLIDFIIGFGKTFLGIIVSVGLGVFKLFINIVNFVAQAWWKLIQKLDEWTGGWMTRLLDLFTKIINFISSKLSALLGAAEKLHIPGASTLKNALDAGTYGINTIRDNIREAGGIQNIELNQVFNISDRSEMERMIEENNKKIVDDLFRLVNPTGS